MAKAPIETEFEIKAYPNVKAGIVKWPMSVGLFAVAVNAYLFFLICIHETDDIKGTFQLLLQSVGLLCRHTELGQDTIFLQ